jgi:AcrR family transcriptional regulator
MSSVTDETRRPGRPRDARADGAIIDAAVALIAAGGVDGLRMDEVAATAGVGKAAIYRRYASKDELVTAVVSALVSEIAVPDTGSTAADLRALMREAVALYADPVRAGVVVSVVRAMNGRPELARAVREDFLGPRRAALRTVLERGVARGDLRAELDVELALDVLGGPLFYRLLVTGGPVDERLADAVAELILRGFAR